MGVTIRDVAAASGVHHTTVSRALNPATSGLISPQTAERVRRAAEDLGYTPNLVARSLKRSRTGTVGVMVSDLATSVMSALVRGADDVLTAAGYVCLVVSSDDRSDRERILIRTLTARGVDGLIVTSSRLSDPQVEPLVRQGFPVVLAQRRGGAEDMSNVVGDDETGIHEAVAHLVGLGHRRIAHISGLDDTSTAALRAAAFRRALTEHGLEADERLIRPGRSYRYEEGERLFTELARTEQFTAVVAGNDQLAVGCLDAMHRLGLRCPQDVSVVGFNDMQLVDKLRPALTTVRVPHGEIGAQSARLLLDRIDDPSAAPRTVRVPVALVPRESTAPPPAAPRTGLPGA